MAWPGLDLTLKGLIRAFFCLPPRSKLSSAAKWIDKGLILKALGEKVGQRIRRPIVAFLLCCSGAVCAKVANSCTYSKKFIGNLLLDADFRLTLFKSGVAFSCAGNSVRVLNDPIGSLTL
jgi:hypothetical protein